MTRKGNRAAQSTTRALTLLQDTPDLNYALASSGRLPLTRGGCRASPDEKGTPLPIDYQAVSPRERARTIGCTSRAEKGQKLHKPACKHNRVTALVVLLCSCPPKDPIAHGSPIARGQRPKRISPHRQKGCLGVRWILKGHEHGSNGDSGP
jgi:hypothetical protein